VSFFDEEKTEGQNLIQVYLQDEMVQIVVPAHFVFDFKVSASWGPKNVERIYQ
jgi:hypothetical protein